MNSCSVERSAPAVASLPPLTKKNSQAAKKPTANSRTASYTMEASRRGSPGTATRVAACTVLFAAMLRDRVFALARRQRLVFRPMVAQVAALLRRNLDDLLVGLARLAPLFRRERGPALHAALHALLLLGVHRRVALGDADPLAAALGLQALPVGLERREGLLLLGGELGPGRACRGLGLRRRLGGRLLGRDLGRDVDRRLRQRAAREQDG